MEFRNLNIFITGASSGIGYQLAKDLAAEGANLALLARRKELIDELAKELENITKVKAYKCDVIKREEVKEVIAKIKTDFDKIDVAILNSGVGRTSSVLKYTSSAAEEIFSTNVLGAVYCIEQILPEFISERRGVIAGISSLGDGKGFPKSGFYSASKAALTIILESLRIELKPLNVKVITIKPGFIKTPMIDKNTFNMPYLMSVEKSSRMILNGLRKDKRIIEFPLPTTIAAKFLQIIPTRWFEAIASKEPAAKK